MRLLDSRRLTGPNLLLDRAGAVVDVALAPGEVPAAIELWRQWARRLLEAVGWGREELAARCFPGGASLAFTAPIDALYAATEVNEAVWAMAEAALARPSGAGAADLDGAAARLRAAIAAESNPALLALERAAAAHGVAFLADDDVASVGLGVGCVAWPVGDLPAPAAVDWSRVRDVPVALVTGTNGKTTTVRLLAAMLAVSGKVAGFTSTDRIEVGGKVVERGDYSGPGGARTLLRDPRVEAAVLETARGGILRRGLAVRTADAALVTNVAADHLGDLGVHDLPALAEAKLVVARVVPPRGRLVLPAADRELAAQGLKSGGPPILWFGLDPSAPPIAAALAGAGEAAFLDGEELVLVRGGRRETVARVAEVPIAHGGAARYNLANALGAIGLAAALGLATEPMARGLAAVRGTAADNPGRANLFDVGGFRVLLDYAHNPHGLAALLEFAASFPAARRLIVLGQAGDRDDDALRELARAAWRARPDRVVIKELPSLLRGRAAGEVPAILADELTRLGAPAAALARAASEPEAVRQALAWARPGDLLILLVHTDREEVFEILEEARRRSEAP